MATAAELRFVWSGTLPRELLVGLSGVVLVLFIIAHLAGNFFIFGGPEAYNAYAQHLHALGPLLWVARLGLMAAFTVHVSLTIRLALEDRAARKTPYAVRMKPAETTVAKKTMLYSGLLLFAFIALHITDYALGDQTGPRSVLSRAGANESLGLYGLVWNSFSNPLHSLFYIVALCAVGLHFSSAVSTIWMTFGVMPEGAIMPAKRAAQIAGAIVACAFISIPVYVLVATYLAPH